MLFALGPITEFALPETSCLQGDAPWLTSLGGDSERTLPLLLLEAAFWKASPRVSGDLSAYLARSVDGCALLMCAIARWGRHVKATRKIISIETRA